MGVRERLKEKILEHRAKFKLELARRFGPRRGLLEDLGKILDEAHELGPSTARKIGKRILEGLDWERAVKEHPNEAAWVARLLPLERGELTRLTSLFLESVENPLEHANLALLLEKVFHEHPSVVRDLMQRQSEKVEQVLADYIVRSTKKAPFFDYSHLADLVENYGNERWFQELFVKLANQIHPGHLIAAGLKLGNKHSNLLREAARKTSDLKNVLRSLDRFSSHPNIDKANHVVKELIGKIREKLPDLRDEERALALYVLHRYREKDEEFLRHLERQLLKAYDALEIKEGHYVPQHDEVRYSVRALPGTRLLLKILEEDPDIYKKLGKDARKAYEGLRTYLGSP